MKIWFINQYAIPPSLGGLVRHYYFASYLKKQGHEVKIFTASQIHNSDVNFIPDKKPYVEREVDNFLYTFVKTCRYSGNGWKRIYSMLEFPFRIWKVTKSFEKPDIIYASSPNPFVAVSAVLLSRKLRIPNVIEIRDLWPESIVEYNGVSRNNGIIKALYRLEKWIYTHADQLVFTMEGGKAYLREKKWDKNINGNKIHHVNNGVDLKEYEYNKKHFQITDDDLENPDSFKIIYTGSIRKVNHLDTIVSCAKILNKMASENRIQFLIWGEGPEKERLESKCKDLQLKNIKFKGRVEKKYIPYILSRADLNLMHWRSTRLMRFGCSANKLFDYLASGRPVLSDIPSAYDVLVKYHCGFVCETQHPQDIVKKIWEIRSMDKTALENMLKNARSCIAEYDYKRLALQIEEILKRGLKGQ